MADCERRAFIARCTGGFAAEVLNGAGKLITSSKNLQCLTMCGMQRQKFAD